MIRSALGLCLRCESRLLQRPATPTIPRFRRSIQSQQYQPFTPPSPASLGKATPAKTFARSRKWTRRLGYVVLTGTAIWALDKLFYASSLSRSVRSFGVGIVVAIDYKINFRPHPPLAASITALHARNAQRLYDLLHNNGGLYLKIGQAIAMQSAILPPEFQKMFSKMFDDAPQNDWQDVEKVIREDFGKSPEEVFGVSFDGDPNEGIMEKKARASASVAQVHWARLKDGREVAIKIQKREIAQQVGWDLWSFKVITWVYTWYFDLPLYSLVPYITERLMLETDFVNEANNSERMAELVAHEPRLRDRVYIPRIYRDLSSTRVMTAEWIEGVRLWDKESLTRPWHGGWRKGSPGCKGTPLDPSDAQAGPYAISDSSTKLKPQRDYWRGPRGDGGLGVPLKTVMQTMVDLFSAQMFLWGTVHCDPHPGNIFIRRQPSGAPELVLIDHGLYVDMKPEFRHDYALFWTSLMTFDNATLDRIVKSWGINNADIFASATLMRPYEGGDLSTSAQIRDSSGKKMDEGERAYEMQQKMRAGISSILSDETKWPRELVFLGRNLRIVQGNNQFLGSPVNRIKITGSWASRALADSPDLPWRERARNLGRHMIFRMVMFGSDVVFWVTRVRQLIGWGGGMEDEMEASMRRMAKEMGFELNHGVFDG